MSEIKGRHIVEVTAAEAAEMLHCDRRSVVNMIKRGSIQARMEKIDPYVKKGVYKIAVSEIKRIQDLLKEQSAVVT